MMMYDFGLSGIHLVDCRKFSTFQKMLQLPSEGLLSYGDSKAGSSGGGYVKSCVIDQSREAGCCDHGVQKRANENNF
jgi:hypothetical protein